MRAALDTNLLFYAEGFGDQARVIATRALLEQLTWQAGRPVRQAQEAVLGWMGAFPVLEGNATAWRGALFWRAFCPCFAVGTQHRPAIGVKLEALRRRCHDPAQKLQFRFPGP